MNVPSIRSEWVGRIVEGKYALLNWLGGSPSSGVFLTKFEERNAAIKLVSLQDADRQALLNAWAATKALSHPHLMSQFDFGRCQIDGIELLFTVTEYAEENLAQVLPDRPLTTSETKEMFDPVLETLLYLHAEGFVHGHLRPSNILVVEDQLKLSRDSIQAVASRALRLGPDTVYDPPERATEVLTPAADAWSLGITLIEALTQHPPAWDMFTRLEPSVPGSIPQPFAEIARECLRLDPKSRCSLANVKAYLEFGGPLQRKLSQTPAKKESKVRLFALIGAAAVILAIAAVLLIHVHNEHESSPPVDQQPEPSAAAQSGEPAATTPPAEADQGTSAKGEVIHRVVPDVPQKASRTIQGTVSVRIRVKVDATGKVTKATFESSGPSKYFAKLAMQAAMNWQFRPARVDGRPVSGVWALRFQFRRTGTEASSDEKAP